MTIAPANFLIAAGGTGGHMVPAHAVARELERRGHRAVLITDERGAKIPGLFEGNEVHVIDAATPGKNPLRWPRAAMKILAGRRQAREVIGALQPAAAIGFGGYPVLPAMMAATKGGVPSLICEQNAVLGRVNRLLARRVDAIALSFPQTERLSHPEKAHLTGNPVRSDIAALANAPYPEVDGFSPLRILVLGGSLGARILSQVVPQALSLLPDALRRRLQVLQQAREEDFETVSAAYREAGIPAEITTYLEDVPAALADAHLFIGRSGASTVTELAAAGRPAILVPLPIATDDHQAANTREMVAAGGARMMRQEEFTPEGLCAQVALMLEKPETLRNAARRAKSTGRPDATLAVADLAERLAGCPGGTDVTRETE
ncbi:undecaprenyldiphospho-muramoylpentapeptide beta-N-acetylglucosaminyltransferase [Pacificimonas flava]|uniref:UDP-N-acetylglucosamine--N-acetylmuramyl-(pentapeptide) pyrophosphoryl-undecaprenol N-acetylglucosamine transferase n=2 Tax=Pacificimonas TaxID=1960290 RepID=A0A219B6S2_9SPHN|nr:MULTISPECIES: undecaprenyldiphospho-muramoylpentapeptide beta-N-acetylglucosaminyltransferase [Pacificimonas]MBZ6378905.1 undecaprenyldiphospho-muramoylpentapeptide beta-N-acetylglucosaminyltransferase [Pacificimonas aurantium]OWV33843.1 undecaprenyldiphospho-muramoylpentapeptide beta-N-acetylglucosaminyltransferase [Pacificimonas flava]